MGRSVGTISSTQHDHVATNARTGSLNHRTADRGHVAFDHSFDDHVASQGHRSLFHGAGDLYRVAQSEDGAVVDTIDHHLVFVVCALSTGNTEQQQHPKEHCKDAIKIEFSKGEGEVCESSW